MAVRVFLYRGISSKIATTSRTTYNSNNFVDFNSCWPVDRKFFCERRSAMAISEWRRRKGNDTWHFCKNCSNWPTAAESEIKYTKPTTGELCNECKAKQSNGDCK